MQWNWNSGNRTSSNIYLHEVLGEVGCHGETLQTHRRPLSLWSAVAESPAPVTHKLQEVSLDFID
jgi:hypothetical protein